MDICFMDCNFWRVRYFLEFYLIFRFATMTKLYASIILYVSLVFRCRIGHHFLLIKKIPYTPWPVFNFPLLSQQLL